MKSDKQKHLGIASPCPASWESMKGDDRVRFCELCNLNVYNFAQLTRREVNALVANTEGRLCGRLYRRADGTVITRDCPVGLRALRRRVARVAGAVFTTLMSLSGVVVGQKPSNKDKSSCKKQVTITRKAWESPDGSGVFTGKLLDPFGAVIHGARIAITDQKTRKSISTESNDEGQFRISGLAPGTYEVIIETPGFRKLKVKNVMLGAKQTVGLEMLLEFDSNTATVGLLVAEPLIDTPGKLVINENMIRRIPR